MKHRVVVIGASAGGDAEFPGMSLNAIRYAKIDHVLPVAGMPALLRTLLDRIRPSDNPGKTETPPDEKKGTPSVFSCPDCSGVLQEIRDGELVRYRCQVGHAYSPENMDVTQKEALENALWVALRVLEERIALKRRMSAEARGSRLNAVARGLEQTVPELERHAAAIRVSLADLGHL